MNVRKAERLAILSSCCGFPGEAVLTDSAVIILFAGMIGAGDMPTLLSTSFLPFLNGLCMLPMARLVMRFGHRAVILRALTVAGLAYLLAAAAPWFGGARVGVLLGAILIFSLGGTGFVSGWYPMLDTFLTRESRTSFFGRMRFCHQLSAVLFLLSAAAWLGASPALWQLQAVLFAAALLYWGRLFSIARIPEFPARNEPRTGFRAGLLKAIGNRKLTGFTLYLFMLNLATFGTVPLVMLHLKKGLGAPDNTVVCLSAAAFTGMLLGYLAIRPILRRLNPRRTFLLFHLFFLLFNTAFLCLRGGGTGTWILAGTLLAGYSFLLAGSSILASAEMMELASPGNKVMAMAFSGSFSYGASGLARVLGSLLLGSGLLAAEWELGGVLFDARQTLLLLYSGGILLAGAFLLLVPAVSPVKKYNKERI